MTDREAIGGIHFDNEDRPYKNWTTKHLLANAARVINDTKFKVWFNHDFVAELVYRFYDLREKLEREKNGPLTIEELRQMDGQPVWVEFIGSHATRKNDWFILTKPDHAETLLVGAVYVLKSFEYYGKTWLAYRHPLNGQEPKEKV